MPRTSRAKALAVTLALFAAVFVAWWWFVWSAFGQYTRAEVFVYGLRGPLNVVEAIPRFRYHSALSNAGFLAFNAAILVLPFAYVAWPRWFMLVVSLVGMVAWCVFGGGYSIHHM